MKIVVGIPVLAIVVFLNSICEGRVLEAQAPLVIQVEMNEMVFVGYPNGAFFGGYLEQQRNPGVPAWVKRPMQHNDGLDYIYVEMPNEVGYVTEVKYLTKRPMQGKSIEFVVKVNGGDVVLCNLHPIRRIPRKFVHTRVYLATKDGKLFSGILERAGVKHIKGIVNGKRSLAAPAM